MYLANKVQNIRGSADTLLECAVSRFDGKFVPSPRPWSKAERKSRPARAVTDAVSAESVPNRRHTVAVH